MRRLVLAACCTALLPAAVVAQRPVLVRHYALETMDLGILSDTVRGVTVVAAPSLFSNEGERDAKVTWARFDPDSLLEWLNRADAYLRAPVQPDEPDGERWVPHLRAVDDRGWLTLGRRISKHRLQRRRDAHLADHTYSWRFELTERQVDSLLNLLLEAAALSRLSTPAPQADSLYLCDQPDQPVQIAYQPEPRWPGYRGRVATQFVVDAKGHPEMDTFVALFATHRSLEDPARSAIAASRFKPALLQGRPVRQLVQQVIAWR